MRFHLKRFINFEIFNVSDKKIEPCIACYACREKEICIISDDMQYFYHFAW